MNVKEVVASLPNILFEFYLFDEDVSSRTEVIPQSWKSHSLGRNWLLLASRCIPFGTRSVMSIIHNSKESWSVRSHVDRRERRQVLIDRRDLAFDRYHDRIYVYGLLRSE